MNRTSSFKIIEGLFYFLLPLLPIWIFFREVIRCPGCFLFVPSADGLKNYFTFSYYLRFDQGFHFSGMNYPYGEHLVFTDNIPLLAMLTNLLSWAFPALDNHGVAIVNLVSILSFAVCYVFLFLSFRKIGVSSILAAGGSIGITFLSPQLARLGGHYSLAFAFIIPLGIYCCILLEKECREKLNLLFLFLLIFLSSFIHLYFLLLLSFFFLAYFLIKIILIKNKRKLWARALIITVLSMAAAFIVIKTTDPIKDRPDRAEGAGHYQADFRGLYTPYTKDSGKLFVKGHKKVEISSEKRSYLGLVPILFLPITLFFLFFKKESLSTKNMMLTFFITGVLAFIVGSGIIFQLVSYVSLENLTLINQFRSLGRMGWLTYYVVGFCTVWAIDRFLFKSTKVRNTYLKYALTAILLFAWIWEATHYTQRVARDLNNPNTVLTDKGQNFREKLNELGYLPSDYQAIIVLPFTVVGAEKIFINKGIWTLRKGMQATYQTGIPMVNIDMSRTSVSQALSAMQLLSHPLIEKRRLEDCDDRPFLVIAEEEFLSEQDWLFLGRADSLGQFDEVLLYRILPSQIEVENADISHLAGTNSDYVFKNFEENQSAAFIGVGASRISGEVVDLPVLPDSILRKSDYWELSVWIHIDESSPFFPVMEHGWIDMEGNQRLEQQSIISMEGVDIIGSWVRLHYTFSSGGEMHRFSLMRQGSIYDSFLLRPADEQVVIQLDDERYLLNNQIISR